MKCSKCEKRKYPACFSPSQVKLINAGKYGICRMCTARLKGHEYGSQQVRNIYDLNVLFPERDALPNRYESKA